MSANYNWLSMTGFLIYCYSQSTVKSTEHNECVKIIPLRKYAMCLAATNESQKEIQATVKTSDLSSVKMIIIYSRKGITAALNDISVRQARQANRPQWPSQCATQPYSVSQTRFKIIPRVKCTFELIYLKSTYTS